MARSYRRDDRVRNLPGKADTPSRHATVSNSVAPRAAAKSGE